MSRVTIVVDNLSCQGLAVEHGLALVVDAPAGRFLFDAGASGAVLAANLAALRIPVASLRRVVISHGHDDHTGGLAAVAAAVPELEVYHGEGVTRRRYSCHAGRPPRELTVPAAGQAALARAARRHVMTAFTEIDSGVFLTGPIPRASGEDCGGPFYLDENGREPDLLAEEQAMLLADGTLIHGCCHSGIINTLDWCRQCAPHIPVTAIIGGLHLLHAGPGRLEQTLAALRALPLRRLVLLHCSGADAIQALRAGLACPVQAGQSGECHEF